MTNHNPIQLGFITVLPDIESSAGQAHSSRPRASRPLQMQRRVLLNRMSEHVLTCDELAVRKRSSAPAVA